MRCPTGADRETQCWRCVQLRRNSFRERASRYSSLRSSGVSSEGFGNPGIRCLMGLCSGAGGSTPSPGSTTPRPFGGLAPKPKIDHPAEFFSGAYDLVSKVTMATWFSKIRSGCFQFMQQAREIDNSDCCGRVAQSIRQDQASLVNHGSTGIDHIRNIAFSSLVQRFEQGL